MKTLIIYHRVDFDGLFSYCELRQHFEQLAGYEVDSFGYTHGDSLDALPSFDDYDVIAIADIMLPVEYMKRLASDYASRTIWIDHHATSIDMSVREGFGSLKGIRQSGVAACVLTYCYSQFSQYTPEDAMNVPIAISIIGAYDVWDHDTFDWDGMVAPFQYGMDLMTGRDPDILYRMYEEVIYYTNINKIISSGQDILTYLTQIQSKWCERFAFEVTVADKYKGIAMLSPIMSSEIFRTMDTSKYDVFVVANKDATKEDTYYVSMYSDKPIDFSCGEYMKNYYKGGGHKGAAGGTMTIEQFSRLVSIQKL